MQTFGIAFTSHSMNETSELRPSHRLNLVPKLLVQSCKEGAHLVVVVGAKVLCAVKEQPPVILWPPLLGNALGRTNKQSDEALE